MRVSTFGSRYDFLFYLIPVFLDIIHFIPASTITRNTIVESGPDYPEVDERIILATKALHVIKTLVGVCPPSPSASFLPYIRKPVRPPTP